MNYLWLFYLYKARKTIKWLRKHDAHCDREVVMVVEVKKASWLFDAWLDAIEKKI